MPTVNMDKLLISTYKHKAAQFYKVYFNELESMSCGKELAESINPRIARAKLEFNTIMDKLAELDPNTPKERL